MWNTPLSEAQHRGSGDTDEIAIRCGQTTNPMISVGKTQYLFTTQHNICLCWIKYIDAQRVLDLHSGCCGNNNKRFSVATEAEVRIFNIGGR